MKLALLQLNPIVGDISGNAAKLFLATRDAGDVDLCISAELALCGYPPRDFLLYPDFIDRCWEQAEALAKQLKDLPPLLLGLPTRAPEGSEKPLYNSAVLLQQGQITHQSHKTLLPDYDVFDENRYFQAAEQPGTFTLAGQTIGVSICEDLWNDRELFPQHQYQKNPLQALERSECDLVINLSASPFYERKHQLRQGLFEKSAQRLGCPLVFVNQVGGQDQLIFDGRSGLYHQQKGLMQEAPAFQEHTLIVDTNEPEATPVTSLKPPEEIFQALVCGTRDYVRKCGFHQVVLGLSGGIDSALTALVAAEALGPENVLGLLMPSPYSSTGSLDDSLALAENLNITTETLPIEPIMTAFMETLQPLFAGKAPDVTEENLQSRIRGTLLMAASNKHGRLLLTTGNKSEMAVGYCTLYGDMNGALGVLADVPKQQVYALCRWYNEHRQPVIPEAILAKPPSAELRPDQKDADSLPPYDVLDAIIDGRVQHHQSREKLIEQFSNKADVQRVLQLFERSEFKRNQAAPGLKVTSRAFGTEWRVPIAAKMEV